MNSTQTTYRKRATGVSFDGPFADQNRYGDEFPYWTVCLVDDEGEEAGASYTCHSYSKGFNLATKIANDRRVELIVDASPA